MSKPSDPSDLASTRFVSGRYCPSQSVLRLHRASVSESREHDYLKTTSRYHKSCASGAEKKNACGVEALVREES